MCCIIAAKIQRCILLRIRSSPRFHRRWPMATAMSFAMAPSKMGVSSKEVSQVFHQILPKQKLHCFHLFFFIFFSKTLLPEPPQLSTTPLGIRRGPKRRAKAAIGPVRESKMMVKGLRRYNVDNGDHHRRHKLPKDPKPFNFQQRILEPPSTK